MRERRYRPSLVGPLILIAVGILLLLNQTGSLSWNIWGALWRYWPVILILLGLEVLVGVSQSRLLYLLGVLVAAAVLVGVIAFAVLQGGESPAERPITDSETILQGLQDAERGMVTLGLGAGTVRVSALTDSPNLVEGKIEYAEESRQAEQRFGVRNGRAEFELRGRQEVPIWIPGGRMNETWQLRFTPRIPLEMRIDVGAGSISADLSGLRIARLNVNMGVGSSVLTLPQVEGTTVATVKLAIGDVTVVIPSGVGLKISANRLLSTLNVDGHALTRSGADWVSADYATAPSRIDLHIDNVIGTINVR